MEIGDTYVRPMRSNSLTNCIDNDFIRQSIDLLFIDFILHVITKLFVQFKPIMTSV